MASGRTRRRAGWALIGVGAAVAALLAASRWWAFSSGGSSLRGHLVGGVLSIVRIREASPANTAPTLLDQTGITPIADPALRWWIDSNPSNFPVWSVGIAAYSSNRIQGPGFTFQVQGLSLVLWPIALGTAGLGVLLLRSGHRTRPPGTCPHCRYDLTALSPGTPCPECGRPGENRTETLR